MRPVSIWAASPVGLCMQDGNLIQWIQCFVRLENTDIGCLVRVDCKEQKRGFNVKKNLHSYLA